MFLPFFWLIKVYLNKQSEANLQSIESCDRWAIDIRPPVVIRNSDEQWQIEFLLLKTGRGVCRRTWVRGRALYKMNNGFCAYAQADLRRVGKPEGFTLVELMVVIALMAILLALALPSFRSLTEKFRVDGMVSALTASMSHARSEAARRGTTVTLQQRTDCPSQDWNCGWDTVVGRDDDIETLRRQDPDTQVSVAKNTAGGLSFNAMGGSANVAGFHFHPAGRSDSTNDVMVCVALSGRARLVKGASQCAP
jgi:type IV fimbrial biogenesis protein FimT